MNPSVTSSDDDGKPIGPGDAEMAAAPARTTTQIGDELRDHVVMLLESAGHRLEREVRVDTKKVDLLLTLDDEFYARRVAIECKNLAKVTSQDDLAIFHAGYSSLVMRGEITEVWVVVRKGFSPDARNWATKQANFHVFTIAEFEEQQEGFRKYVRQLSSIFAEDALEDYYIKQRLLDGTSLSDRVMDWMSSSDDRPIALLGGYGMGKTSFCRYLVHALGQRYLEDPRARVPIYIRLSDIAKEQDLDGLVAKTLAQRYAVKNYHFHKFLELNRRGKFVVVFDGFDEMKHALSWAEFKYNFTQINRVVGDRAKVIIAGRPNAFLSDDEHNWALRGVRSAGERLQRIPGWPEYLELEMGPFDDHDARLFLERFLKGRAKASGLDDAWVQGRVKEFDSLKHKAELLRPVHLRIFAEIAADPEVVLRDFTVYELYDVAADRIADRDAEKPQRALIEGATRRGFIEDVAWWVWEESEGRSLAFNPARVPLSIVRKAFPQGADLSDEAMQREVFSGSFIERKHGDNFYFAHRSFLEFFVANTLSRARLKGLSLGVIDRALNPEILGFVQEGGHGPEFLDYVVQLMNRFAGELDHILLRAVRERLGPGPHDTRLVQPAVDLVLNYLFVYEGDFDADRVWRLSERFRTDLQSEVEERCDAAMFFVADVMRSVPDELVYSLARAVLSHCAASVAWAYWQRRAGEEATMPVLSYTRRKLAEWAFLRCARLAAERDSSGQAMVVIDLDRFYADLYEVRRPKIVPLGREPAAKAQNRVLRMRVSDVDTGVKPGERAAMLDVLKRGVDARIGS